MHALVDVVGSVDVGVSVDVVGSVDVGFSVDVVGPDA